MQVVVWVGSCDWPACMTASSNDWGTGRVQAVPYDRIAADCVQVLARPLLQLPVKEMSTMVTAIRKQACGPTLVQGGLPDKDDGTFFE